MSVLWVNKFYFYNLCVYSPHISTILGSLSICNFLKWFISGISVYPKHWLIKCSFSADFETRNPHNSSIKSFVFANIVWDNVHTEETPYAYFNILSLFYYNKDLKVKLYFYYHSNSGSVPLILLTYRFIGNTDGQIP